MTKYPVALAFRLANEIADALRPGCERLAIVGSVRRNREMVKDVELLVCPKHHTDLLGQPVGSHVDDLLLGMARQAAVSRDHAPLVFPPIKNGDRYKQFVIRHDVPKGAPQMRLDLFVADIEAWGPAMAIRTGPAEFSRKLVINRCRGGLLADDLAVADGYRLWRGRRVDEAGDLEFTGTLVECRNEREFFETHCGLWIPPEERDAFVVNSKRLVS